EGLRVEGKRKGCLGRLWMLTVEDSLTEEATAETAISPCVGSSITEK
ncbi:unnamed protein product, partial [marine sediment metagenome]